MKNMCIMVVLCVAKLVVKRPCMRRSVPSTSNMTKTFEGTKTKTVIGISKYGHVLYGPYDDNGELWSPPDVDACNGVWSENRDEYFYVSTRWHPYGTGCHGPTNLPFEEGLYPNCSTNGMDQYLVGLQTSAPSLPTGLP